MSDRTAHVAPLPPGHRPALDCPCGPLVSMRDSVTNEPKIVVHRTDVLAPAREGEKAVFL